MKKNLDIVPLGPPLNRGSTVHKRALAAVHGPFVSVVDADRGVAVMGGECTVPPLSGNF